MSFHEKSAWIMGVLLSLTGFWYISQVWSRSDALGETIAPDIVLIAVATGMLVFGAIISHIIIAAGSPEEANDAEDERDKQVLRRAGNISGYVLGFGIFAGLWHYYFLSDGNMLFHIAVASLIASQVAEYALTIIFYRRGV
jgi:uncharacterized membrane protein